MRLTPQRLGNLNHIRSREYAWLIANLDGKYILDAGCCESNLGPFLVRRGYKVVGVDIKDYDLRPRHDNWAFRKADLRKLPFKGDEFDLISNISTIEHIGFEGSILKDPEGDIKAMKELRRVLKTEGTMILTTPYRCRYVQANSRNYSPERISKLTVGFKTKNKIIWTSASENRSHWIATDKEIPTQFNVIGLVLKKK